MSWLADALGGPVLAWEAKRTLRRKWWYGLQIGYVAWLLLQALMLFGAASPPRRDPGPLAVVPELTLRMRQAEQFELRQKFLEMYFDLLLKCQLGFVIALVPAFTASSLGQEKERGTLFALFCTQLTSTQILLGMLLGRLLLLMPLVLGTLPLLVFVGNAGGRGVTPVLLAVVQQVIVVLALGLIGLLFGIWIRGATEAVVAAYLCLSGLYVVLHVAAGPVREAISPFDNIDMMVRGGARWEFLIHLAVWVVLGFIALRIGTGRLRQVCVEQHDRKPPRRLWAFRPAVGNDPIRWRECYVIGLAPLPVLKIVPRWLALIGVFLFATVLNSVIAGEVSPKFISALLQLDVFQAYALLQFREDAKETVPLMGLAYILLFCLVIGVRCGTSIPEEKRRNTWDDLLLTAQSFREITRAKMWGILQGVFPYVIAYALPVFIRAWLHGPSAVIQVGFFIVLPSTIVFVAALCGIDMVNVPPEMDETREGGAFWFENPQFERRRKERRREKRDEPDEGYFTDKSPFD